MQDGVVGAVEPRRGVLDASLDELGALRDGFGEAGGEVVEDGDPVAPFQEVGGDDAPHVSRPARHQIPLGHALATSRSRRAASSGRTSFMKAPMPDSVPARNLSLPGARRTVKSSRWSPKSSRRPSVNGAWCQAAM